MRGNDNCVFFFGDEISEKDSQRPTRWTRLARPSCRTLRDQRRVFLLGREPWNAIGRVRNEPATLILWIMRSDERFESADNELHPLKNKKLAGYGVLGGFDRESKTTANENRAAAAPCLVTE